MGRYFLGHDEGGGRVRRAVAGFIDGVAVVGGLTSSTILSPFLVPMMFLLFAPRPAAIPEPLPAQLAAAHP
jgi:Cu/Ag efflux pump CusA